MIEVRSGASEASGAENFTYVETVNKFAPFFCSTDFSATDLTATKNGFATKSDFVTSRVLFAPFFVAQILVLQI